LDNGTLDVRLSLRTTDRKAARNMGAALTAVTPRVLDMLDRRARQKTDITEQELQAIAKAMYEERLAEVCTLQRSTPYDFETHSAANLAFIDYFERLKNQGGHMSLLPDDERTLEAEGWSAQRIADLRTIVAMREERGIDPIRQDEIDRHLAAAGFALDDRLRWMLELLGSFDAEREAQVRRVKRVLAVKGQKLLEAWTRRSEPSTAHAQLGPRVGASTDVSEMGLDLSRAARTQARSGECRDEIGRAARSATPRSIGCTMTGDAAVALAVLATAKREKRTDGPHPSARNWTMYSCASNSRRPMSASLRSSAVAGSSGASVVGSGSGGRSRS
jgi:hypothetical protein